MLYLKRQLKSNQPTKSYLCHLSSEHLGNIIPNVRPELTLYMAIRHMARDHSHQTVQGFSSCCFQWHRSVISNETDRLESKKINDTHLEKGAIPVQTVTNAIHLPSPQDCI